MVEEKFEERVAKKLIDQFITVRNLLEDEYRSKQIKSTQKNIDICIENHSHLINQMTQLLPKGKVALEQIQLISDVVYQIKSLSRALQGKFMLFIMGGGKNGKSTLINALIGQTVAEENINPKTWKIDVFVDKDSDKVELKYKDGKKDLVDLFRANAILEEEDRKFEEGKKRFREAKKEVPKGLSSAALKEQHEELRKKYMYRSNLAEMEYPVENSELLRKYNIVDTPGLNQEFFGEVSANAKEYYRKADGVIWVLPGDKLSADADKKEINNILKEYGRSDNIIIVINKLDNILANGQTIEGVLSDAKKLYGDISNEFIPISAKKAKEAMEILSNFNSTPEEKMNAKSQLKESNFLQLQDHLERKLLNNAVNIQIEQKINNTRKLLSEIRKTANKLSASLGRVKKTYDTQIQDWREIAKITRKLIKNERKMLETRLNSDVYSKAQINENMLWNIYNNPSSNMSGINFIRDKVIELPKIRQSLERYTNDIIYELTKHYEYHMRESTFHEYEILAMELENLNGRPSYPSLNASIDLSNITIGVDPARDLLGKITNWFKQNLGKSMADRIKSSFEPKLSKVLDAIEKDLIKQIDYATKAINNNRINTFTELYGDPKSIEELQVLLKNVKSACSLRMPEEITLEELLEIDNEKKYKHLYIKVEDAVVPI